MAVSKGYGQVESISSDSATLMLRSLSIETTKKILAVLAEADKETK